MTTSKTTPITHRNIGLEMEDFPANARAPMESTLVVGEAGLDRKAPEATRVRACGMQEILRAINHGIIGGVGLREPEPRAERINSMAEK